MREEERAKETKKKKEKRGKKRKRRKEPVRRPNWSVRLLSLCKITAVG
jgi:hypothetical protein